MTNQSATSKPGLLLIAQATPMTEGLSSWFSDDYRVVIVGNYQTCMAELGQSPEIVLLIDTVELALELRMPDFATAALGLGCRVIRMATDTNRFDSRWDTRVIHLPLGVRPTVLSAAMKGCLADQAES